MNEIVLSGIIAVVSSAISSFVTYLLTKRKYNAEVDNNLIINMQQSLEFYQKIVTDNKERIEAELSEKKELLEEMNKLKESNTELQLVLAETQKELRSTRTELTKIKKMLTKSTK